MAHGFGLRMDDLKANDLAHIVNKRGYDTEVNGSAVTVHNQTGVWLDVVVIDGKYIMKAGKEIAYKSVSSVVSKIDKAFNKLLEDKVNDYD